MTSEWQKVEGKFMSFRASSSVEAIKGFRRIKEAALSPAQKLKFLGRLVAEELLHYPETLSGPIPLDIWKDIVKDILEMLDILGNHTNIIFTLKYDSQLRNNYYKGAECEDQVHVVGDLGSLAGGFVFEFLASLNCVEPHTPEYKRRLKEEPTVLLICHNILKYLESRKDFVMAAQVAEIVVNLVHYKSQRDYDVMQKGTEIRETRKADVHRGQSPLVISDTVPRDPIFPENCTTLMEELVNLIYKYGDKEAKAFTMLCHIYHLSVMDKFSDSLMLMKNFLEEAEYNFLSQIQPGEYMTSENFDNQIRFNRAMTQLGLCAFRAGRIEEAHSCLSWLHRSTGGTEEKLLGQHRLHTPSAREAIPIEKSGHIPCPMHINLRMLEAIHLICIMLVEVPKMVADNPKEGKGAVINHMFRTSLGINKHDMPECVAQINLERIISASMALEEGDFRKSFSCIGSLDMWNLFENPDVVLEMLKTKISEVALRIYISKSPTIYSLSLSQLYAKFGLSQDYLQRIVSTTTSIKEQLQIWDQHTPCIFFDKVMGKLSIYT